jgi:exodeoxyribonuclease-3
VSPFTVATWNVNGIRAREAQFSGWMARDRPDLVCLQEIKSPREKVPELICNPPGYACYWHGTRAYSGVALLVRRERFGAPTFEHPGFDAEERVVLARLGELIVASVYVPNGGRDFPAKVAFLEQLIAWCSSLRGRALLVCGDLNVARAERDVHPKERKPGAIGQRDDERLLFQRLLDTGLVDVARALHPDDDGIYTWWAPWRNLRQRNIGWRIDYVLAGGALAASATRCDVLRDVGTSDHAPVMVRFG